MTRKKVKLAYITNDSARKATFKKRKKGLMKKVSELSTLCGIDACAIIYSPYEAQPDVWPNGPGVQRVLSQFKRMPEMEQSKKMVNQEGFIRQRIVKASEQLKKQHRDNREKEMTEVMYQCLSGNRGLQDLGLGDLHDLGWLIDQNLKEIYKRMETINKSSDSPNPPPAQNIQAGPSRARDFGPRNMMFPPGMELGQGGPSRVSDIGSSSRNIMGFNPGMSMGMEDQKPIMMDNMGLEAQRPQWFTEWMNNPNEAMGFGAAEEQIMLPFGDVTHNPNNMWSPYFP
ncbi:agamous-like MADS-box protein AGL80 [Impatiens glandulifera]|uniref:agamous-like MADS-box protein AGL80 n=1 Tax=Impatiens glandulifera TaxID=253017 RepID=UPI001FB1585E|nr:agamous-like MADS-box protein AGL80 [Impatiens glandulifera]